METDKFLRSIIEQDTAKVVVCDLDNKVVYINKRAREAYGDKILNKSIFDCHNKNSQELICKVVDWFKKSKENNIVHTFYNEKHNKDVYMVALRDENGELIGYYEKHEYRNRDFTPFYDLK